MDDYTLNDFLELSKTKLGGRHNLMAELGLTTGMIHWDESPEQAVKRITPIIHAMTEEEREHPEIIDFERCNRIAAACRTYPHEVEHFLAEFDNLRTSRREMARMRTWQRLKLVTGFSRAGLLLVGGILFVYSVLIVVLLVFVL